jgi:hypothetical protein
LTKTNEGDVEAENEKIMEENKSKKAGLYS